MPGDSNAGTIAPYPSRDRTSGRLNLITACMLIFMAVTSKNGGCIRTRSASFWVSARSWPWALVMFSQKLVYTCTLVDAIRLMKVWLQSAWAVCHLPGGLPTSRLQWPDRRAPLGRGFDGHPRYRKRLVDCGCRSQTPQQQARLQSRGTLQFGRNPTSERAYLHHRSLCPWLVNKIHACCR